MKIVKFKNGKYGIRREVFNWFGNNNYEYFSFGTKTFWVSIQYQIIPNIQSNLEQCREVYNALEDSGEVIE